MQSDNGSDFVNQMIAELTKLNGINHRTISAYNPRANGAVVRTNATIENILKKEVEGAMHELPDFVPYVQLSFNAKTSALTGATPFSLMFGRGLNNFEKYGRTKKASQESLILWKARQKEVVDVVYPAISDRTKVQKEKMECAFARSHRIIPDDAFPPGALVMMWDQTRESKWDPAYEGPFIVVRKNRGGAYVLRDKLGEILKRTVPADQLKLVQRENGGAAVEPKSYAIKQITKHRAMPNRKFEYFVVWKDDGIEPGWEPAENFDDIDVIRKYWKSVRPTRRPKPKPSRS